MTPEILSPNGRNCVRCKSVAKTVVVESTPEGNLAHPLCDDCIKLFDLFLVNDPIFEPDPWKKLRLVWK